MLDNKRDYLDTHARDAVEKARYEREAKNKAQEEPEPRPDEIREIFDRWVGKEPPKTSSVPRKIFAILVCSWIVVISYVLLVDPFGYRMNSDDWTTLFKVFLIPPIALEVIYFVLIKGFQKNA